MLGCVVDVAANGVEAVAMWEQFPCAMECMDCQMPDMDDYLAKPVKTGQVAATLERWITLSTLAGNVFQAGRDVTGGDSPSPK